MELLDASDFELIAFPALGAGTAKFSYEEVAARMAEVIADALLNRKRPVDVTIYLFDDWVASSPLTTSGSSKSCAARAPP